MMAEAAHKPPARSIVLADSGRLLVRMSSPNVRAFVQTGKKIIAVGRNYRAHAAELGNPVPSKPFVFFKPTTAYISEGQPIKLPKDAAEIHHEVELGVIIGTEAKSVPESRALDHVAGYFLALDMTDRVAQQAAKSKGLPWSLAKGFDTSCPASKFIPKDDVADPQNVGLWLKVNGEMRQDGNTRDQIFSAAYLISWLSEYFTLEPGDAILTGTPEGVGPVKAGDNIDCGLTGLVEMSFTVEA